MTEKMTEAQREIEYLASDTHAEIMAQQAAAAAEQKKPEPEVDLDHKWEPAWRVFQIVLAVLCVAMAYDVQTGYAATGRIDNFKASLVIGLVIYGIMVGIWRLWLASSDLVRDLSDDSDAE